MRSHGSALSAEPPRPVVFRADHPFVFVLRENATDMVLFMGRLTDPRAH